MPKAENPHNRHNLPYLTHPSQKAKISMVPTPIGNLDDVSHRMLDAYQGVDELWCEDTRHTQALLNALHIEKKRTQRVDQHTTKDELRRLMKRVELEGQWVGVVTDAGTPGISDPGALISELISEFPGIRLEPIPGPSAISTFISIAGLIGNSFTFQGFFPRSESEALEQLNFLKSSNDSPNLIFFESPNRIRDTLLVLETWSKTLEFTPKFTLAKELSKMHETIVAGEGTEFLQWLQGQPFDERGEWVFAIVLPKNCVKTQKDEANWMLTLECLIQAGISTKDAAQIISTRYDVVKKLAYSTALEMQKKSKI